MIVPEWRCEPWPIAFIVPMCMMVPAMFEAVWIHPPEHKLHLAARKSQAFHSKKIDDRQSACHQVTH